MKMKWHEYEISSNMNNQATKQHAKIKKIKRRCKIKSKLLQTKIILPLFDFLKKETWINMFGIVIFKNQIVCLKQKKSVHQTNI